MMTELLRDVFMYAPDATLVVDQHGLILLANEAAENLFGYAGSGIIGQPVEMLMPEEVRLRHVLDRGSYMLNPTRRRMGEDMNLRALTSTGAVIPVQVMLAPAQHNGSHFTIAAVRPIDEPKGKP